MWTSIVAVFTSLFQWLMSGNKAEVEAVRAQLASALADGAALKARADTLAALVQEKDRRIVELETLLAASDPGDLFDGLFAASDPKTKH